MHKPHSFFRLVLITLTMVAACISTATAYQNYSTNGTDNCAACHGDFRAAPYISLADNTSWGDDLHDVHRTTMLNSDCAVCHTSPNRFPVTINSSDGGTNLDPLSCVGCHGRDNGSGTITGTGLRQHHFINGQTVCFDCHTDSDPATVTPVGEDVMPPYYMTPDAAHPNKPTNPCNPNGEENFAATPIGLDNDGDNIYDQADTDCQIPAPDINLNPLALTFGEMPVGSSTTMNTLVQNLGTAPLNVTAIDLCAGTSMEFTWMPSAPFTLAPGTSQSLAVTYAPVDEGLDSGCLVITSNDPNEATKQLQLNPIGSILQYLPGYLRKDQTGNQ